MPEAAAPTPRPAITTGRLATESLGILAPLGTLIAWAVTLLPVEVPAAVSAAVAALVVSLGSMALSELRNGRASVVPKAGVVFGLLGVLLLGCATFDGDAYKRIAGSEIVVLRGGDALQPISEARCFSLAAGAEALRNEEGTSSSPKLPFFAGQHVDELAESHDRQAAVCYELAQRDADRGVAGDLRVRNRVAWEKTWLNGRALLGGPEEE